MPAQPAVVSALVSAALLLLCADPATAASLPHIFLVVVDDLGWANVGNRAGGGNGSTTASEAQTPNFDRLASAGIRLNRHYTYNFCSPSRASLQSGRLPMHVSFKEDNPTVWNPDDPVSGYAGIPTEMTGLAQKMKSAGYSTHMTGKWDAGMATWAHTPMGRGYDSFFGYYHHANDYYSETLGALSTVAPDICQSNGTVLADLWRDQHPATGENGTVYEEQMFSTNTLAVIREHDPAVPLFLFHSFHLIHTPLQVPQSYQDAFAFLKDPNRRLYAAMVKYMDDQLGSFVQALEEKQMWEDTLMVVMSDNGGPIYAGGVFGEMYGGANNIPLKGGKLSDWEGGVRVNAFVSGGFVPESQRGTQNEDYIHIADWYATFCHLAGVNSTDPLAAAAGLPPVDSINQWGVLSGTAEQAPRTDIYLSSVAYIREQYKVITGNMMPQLWGPEANLAGYWPGWGPAAANNTWSQKQNCSSGCLYDIRSDPYEYHDLAAEQPQVLASMKAALEALNRGVFEPERGNQSMLACDAGIHKYGGFYGPFVL